MFCVEITVLHDAIGVKRRGACTHCGGLKEYPMLPTPTDSRIFLKLFDFRDVPECSGMYHVPAFTDGQGLGRVSEAAAWPFVKLIVCECEHFLLCRTLSKHLKIPLKSALLSTKNEKHLN